MKAQVDFDELLYQITLRFDSSLTPAEARALSSAPEEKKSLAWLTECLRDVAIDHERISTLSEIDPERFNGVGLVAVVDKFFLFSHDDLKQTVTFKEIGGDLNGYWVEIAPFLKTYEDVKIYRFFERETEHLAVIPGIEKHWFFAPLWKNRKFLSLTIPVSEYNSDR